MFPYIYFHVLINAFYSLKQQCNEIFDPFLYNLGLFWSSKNDFA